LFATYSSASNSGERLPYTALGRFLLIGKKGIYREKSRDAGYSKKLKATFQKDILLAETMLVLAPVGLSVNPTSPEDPNRRAGAAGPGTELLGLLANSRERCASCLTPFGRGRALEQETIDWFLARA